MTRVAPPSGLGSHPGATGLWEALLAESCVKSTAGEAAPALAEPAAIRIASWGQPAQLLLAVCKVAIRPEAALSGPPPGQASVQAGLRVTPAAGLACSSRHPAGTRCTLHSLPAPTCRLLQQQRAHAHRMHIFVFAFCSLPRKPRRCGPLPPASNPPPLSPCGGGLLGNEPSMPLALTR